MPADDYTENMRIATRNCKARQIAYDTVKRLIMNAELRPGQSVTEIGLSERLGISRTPVREALADLEQEGLIVTTNRRKRVYMLSVHEVEDIFDLKIEIEGAVAQWAAQRVSQEQCKQLRAATKRMKALAGKRPADELREPRWLRQWLAVGQQLHAIFFEAAGNKRAQQTIATLNAQWHQLKVGMLTLEGRVEKSVGEHERIIEAVCARRSTEARKHMRKHLQNLKRELVRIMKLANYPSD